MSDRQAEPSIRMLSEAVQLWRRFYKVAPDDRASNTLCSAAVADLKGFFGALGCACWAV